ncbi:serine carboxypeptidase S28 [Nitzschia inconspicua]|uniref:Serine carboxypeptidase S28 n=1 Tax=Nitzschia inconspicua TaxID=303405 RepID=A0A9K3PXE6_9STRA|nr:serine carboxypeptidase S28 [Nitzschia inconspicua]
MIFPPSIQRWLPVMLPILAVSWWCAKAISITTSPWIDSSSTITTSPLDFNDTFDPNVTEYWFDTVVDHFNFRPTPEPTFPLRYLVNDQYYHNASSPVLFYAGNEADIFQFVNNSGFLWEAAENFQGMVVFAEHRYYGKSFPFGSPENALSPKNISYLSVEQAMADFNLLQGHIRDKWNMSRDAAFVVAGGSYGGNLALWLRLKNPNLWAGAIASSATPLKHLLRETNAFNRIVADVYRNVSHTCPDLIRQGWQELYTNVKTKHGRQRIQYEMKLCHVPERRNPRDIADEIHGWVSGALETMVQYGYPYPTNFFAPVPGYPFKLACKNMLQEQSALGALRAAAQVFYNYTGQAGDCFDWVASAAEAEENDLLVKTRKTLESTRYWNRLGQIERGVLSTHLEDLTGTAWGYQCCTEAYQPMPTNGITDFELPYQPNETEYFERCKQRWEGVVPRPTWEETMFLSDNIQAGSNIFLTSGQLDPWRAAGIQSVPRGSPDSIIVRIIENGAHHLDLRHSHPMDPPSVVEVRKEEMTAMEKWIIRWRNLYPSSIVHASEQRGQIVGQRYKPDQENAKTRISTIL